MSYYFDNTTPEERALNRQNQLAREAKVEQQKAALAAATADDAELFKITWELLKLAADRLDEFGFVTFVTGDCTEFDLKGVLAGLERAHGRIVMQLASATAGGAS